jgi:hypothetical protein
MQYCSLNDLDPLGKIDSAGALAFARAQLVVTHFALHAARIDPIPAGDDTFLQKLIEDSLVQGFPVQRGK